MIAQTQIKRILEDYDKGDITIGTLGGHSALDICRGAKKLGFKTIVVCQKGREKTYKEHYFNRNGKGCVDEVILVDKFNDIVKKEVQDELRQRNTIFIHNRYFWVYCNFKDIENKFQIPIFGSRSMLKLEERDIPKNQYFLMEKAKIRFPKIYKDPKKIDRLVIVKVPEAKRHYERAFFLCSNYKNFKEKSDTLLKNKRINKNDLNKAIIEEYAIGAHVNFNFFYSVMDNELELMGTDIRRQTNLDGVLRLPADEQLKVLDYIGEPRRIETGHSTVTIKESLIEKVYDIGQRFVAITKKFNSPGIIGPFALQGAVTAEEGKEDIVIFDVSMRIPGSPGTMFTPYSAYLYMDPISYGERVAMEIKKAVDNDMLDFICT